MSKDLLVGFLTDHVTMVVGCGTVSIGSCAFIGEYSYDWAASRGLALSVLRVSVRGLPGLFLLVEAKMHV